MTMSGAISAWCYPGQALEAPGKVRLIREARRVGHLEDWGTGGQSLLGASQALLQMVGVRRHSNDARERPREPIGIESCAGGEFRQRNGSITAGPKVFDCTTNGACFSPNMEFLFPRRGVARKKRRQCVKHPMFALENIRTVAE